MLSVARGVAWVGAVIVWWSLNVVWGSDADVGKGPPGHWQRHVVGSGLLALIAAVSLSVSGRRGAPPSWIARGIALACAAGIGIIALTLRSDALADPIVHGDLIAGPGWSWLLAGGGFLLSATTLTFGLKPAGTAGPPSKSSANSTSPSPSRGSGQRSGAAKKKRKKRKR